ncbi:MAG TPA: hypothetical protein VHO90_00115 [Bacteroidales bacterium]|nr:hypothetical protein [Bacteroidales bacterium]
MHKLFNILVALFVFVSILMSCQKIESYSEVPNIEFDSYRVFDTVRSSDFKQRIITIKFKFVDGDGDLGYRQGLDDSATSTNLFFKRFENRNGIMMNVDSLLAKPTQFTIRYDDAMAREGQNKTLKGSIKVDLDELLIKYDTIRYEFYIKDRAGNFSNIVSTPEITGLKKP